MRAPRKIASASGRGISAGQGKTAGRGTKGQGSRSGEGGRRYRQGGHLPFYRRLPFMRGEGFTPPNQVTFNEVNLDQLAEAFQADAERRPRDTWRSRICCATFAIQPSLLGRGDVKVALKVKVHRISATAKSKIEAAGGSVEMIGPELACTGSLEPRRFSMKSAFGLALLVEVGRHPA